MEYLEINYKLIYLCRHMVLRGASEITYIYLLYLQFPRDAVKYCYQYIIYEMFAAWGET